MGQNGASQGQGVLLRILDGLSKPQKRAVTANERYLRIVAAAGAGKTETITRRIVYLIACGAAPESIVAFTFTEKAAQSMKERILLRVREILGEEVCRTLGPMFVGTIHSYAGRILRDWYGYGNYDVLDENQEVAFLLQRGRELGFGDERVRRAKGYSEFCLSFLKSHSVVNHELLRLEDLRGPDEEFAKAVRAYWDLLDRNRLLTFDRMIRLASERVRQNPGVLGVKHLIVDEYQDINRAQEDLIYRIISSGDACCTVVGDPRQCIYEWRGSDPGCFERFAQIGARTVQLSDNFRSTGSVIQIANRTSACFAQKEMTGSMTGFRRDPGLAVLNTFPSPKEEADWVARQVRKLIDGGASPGDIAILLRSVSTSGGEFSRALEEQGVPYLVAGSMGLLRRPETKAMAFIWFWFADQPWREWGKEVASAPNLLSEAANLWPGHLDVYAVQLFKQHLFEGRFPSLLSAYYDLLGRLGVRGWPPVGQNIPRLANLGRFSEILLDFEAAVWREGGRLSWKALLGGLCAFITSYASTSYGEASAEDLPEVNAVNLSTIHQAKGLEWKVVFVPCLVSRRFPSSNTGAQQDWSLSRTLFDAKRYEGTEDAERRLFYVAVTRARDTLVLSRFCRITWPVKPSPFLEELGRVPVCRGDLPLGDVIVSPKPREQVLSASVGDAIDYYLCPYGYRMRNEWGFKPELVRPLGFGRSVHHVLRVLAKLAKEGHDPKKLLRSVVDRHFFLPYEGQRTIENAKPRVERAVRRLLEKYEGVLENVEEVESHLQLQVGKQVTLTGRADVIVSQGDTLQVVDYKTTKGDSRKDVGLQLQLYAAGLKEAGQSVGSARVIYVLENGTADREIPVDPISLASAKETARKCLVGISLRQFPPCRDKGICQQCDVRAVCYHR